MQQRLYCMQKSKILKKIKISNRPSSLIISKINRLDKG